MFRSVVIGITALVGAASATQAQTWTIDPSHTAAQFAVRHMMISTVRGQLGKVTGTVTFDPAQPQSMKIDATIDVAGIDTRVPGRDNDLRSANFFDVEKFPTMTFKSTKVDVVPGGGFKVAGDLTIKGITRQVVLDVAAPSAPIKDQRGGAKMGTSATTKINRQEFGITWSRALDGGGVVVGDEVSIIIDVELSQPPPAK